MRADETGPAPSAGAALEVPTSDLHRTASRWRDLRADLDAARAGVAGEGAAGFGPTLSGPVAAWLARWHDDVSALGQTVDDLAEGLVRSARAYVAVDDEVASLLGRISR